MGNVSSRSEDGGALVLRDQNRRKLLHLAIYNFISDILRLQCLLHL